MYINDMGENIKALNCGIEINAGQLSLLLYAEDVVLAAPSETLLQRKMDILNDWCKKWRLTVNKDKTKVIHFCPVYMERCQANF